MRGRRPRDGDRRSAARVEHHRVGGQRAQRVDPPSRWPDERRLRRVEVVDLPRPGPPRLVQRRRGRLAAPPGGDALGERRAAARHDLLARPQHLAAHQVQLGQAPQDMAEVLRLGAVGGIAQRQAGAPALDVARLEARVRREILGREGVDEGVRDEVLPPGRADLLEVDPLQIERRVGDRDELQVAVGAALVHAEDEAERLAVALDGVQGVGHVLGLVDPVEGAPEGVGQRGPGAGRLELEAQVLALEVGELREEPPEIALGIVEGAAHRGGGRSGQRAARRGGPDGGGDGERCPVRQ